MNESTRTELLELVTQLGQRYPQMRFGQLVSFAAFLVKGPTPQAVWEVADEELLTALREHLCLQRQQ